MRDRLIEAVKKAFKECKGKSCQECVGYGKGADCIHYVVADHLLTNGVVVPLLQTGQIVYRVSKGRMWEVKIWKIEICGKTISYIDNYDKSFLSTHIGKGVFLTREEAEAKLKGGVK